MNDSSQEGYLCPEWFEPKQPQVIADEQYYGWTNRQTFDVYRWIVSASSAKYYDQFIGRLKADNVDMVTMIQRVGDDMKDLVSEQLLSSDFTSDIVRQLANQSFLKVDWKEIAKSWIKCVPVDFEDASL